MLLRVDCLPNAVGKQPSIPLIYLGGGWTLNWWWWWWWWWIYRPTLSKWEVLQFLHVYFKNSSGGRGPLFKAWQATFGPWATGWEPLLYLSGICNKQFEQSWRVSWHNFDSLAYYLTTFAISCLKSTGKIEFAFFETYFSTHILYNL